MSLKILDVSTMRTIKQLSMLDAGSVLHPLKQLSLKDAGGTLRPIFAGITAVASPDMASGSISQPFPDNVTTTSTTATPTGGIAPYTYSWTIVDVTTGDWAIDSPATASTTFSSFFVAPGSNALATFQCTVTDAIGSTAGTNIVTATAQNSG